MSLVGLSQCLSSGALIGKNNPVTRMSWSEFKMPPAKRERVKRCNMSKSITIDAFFASKNGVLAIVPAQSEAAVPSTSFVTVMSMCLALVTKTLLYCRPLMAIFAVAHVQLQSTSSKLSWIQALILSAILITFVHVRHICMDVHMP